MRCVFRKLIFFFSLFLNKSFRKEFLSVSISVTDIGILTLKQLLPLLCYLTKTKVVATKSVIGRLRN